MDVSRVLRVLRRRWLVLVVLLLATAGATGWVYTHVPVAYQAQATVIVLLPNENNDGTSTYPVNPYLNVGAAASQVAASALASISTSEEFLTAIAADGATSATTVEVAGYGGGVVLVLSATNDDSSAVQSDLAIVSSRIATELADRQTEAGAPEGTFLTASDLTAASPATVLSGDRNKLAAVTAVIGLLDTGAVLMVAETLGRRRRRSRADRSSDGGVVPPVGVVAEAGTPPTTADVAPAHTQLGAADRSTGSAGQPAPTDPPVSEGPALRAEVGAVPGGSGGRDAG